MNFLFLVFVAFLFNSHQENNTVTATAKVDGVVYNARVIRKDESVLIKSKNKTILHITNKELDPSGGIANLEFHDFNGDGYKDLWIEYFANNPICDLYMYDKTLKKFIKLQGFSNYPASIKIPKTNIYYSYHRSGCADADWGSDLYKIVDYKTITIGTISCNACDDDNRKNGIFVYKTEGKNKQLIKRMSIQKINDFDDTKWGLIANYWKHNYKKF